MVLKLKNGDILLYKDESNWRNFFTSVDRFVQFLIKIGTFSQYSHVGILLNADPKKITVGQALNQGFVICDQMGYVDRLIREKKIVVYRTKSPLTKLEFAKIKKYANNIKDKGYDWKGIFRILIHICSGRTLLKDSANKYFCSEAVVKAYRVAARVLVKGKVDGLVTPADLSRSPRLKWITLKELE